MGKDDDEVRITLRLPVKIRDQLTEAAIESARSMNGEIVSRLETSFNTPYPQLSGYGFQALITRFESTVDALDLIFEAQRDKVVKAFNIPDREQWDVLLAAPVERHTKILSLLSRGRLDEALHVAGETD